MRQPPPHRPNRDLGAKRGKTTLALRTFNSEKPWFCVFCTWLFYFLTYLQSFSCYAQRVMSCFAVVWSTYVRTYMYVFIDGKFFFLSPNRSQLTIYFQSAHILGRATQNNEEMTQKCFHSQMSFLLLSTPSLQKHPKICIFIQFCTNIFYYYTFQKGCLPICDMK